MLASPPYPASILTLTCSRKSGPPKFGAPSIPAVQGRGREAGLRLGPQGGAVSAAARCGGRLEFSAAICWVDMKSAERDRGAGPASGACVSWPGHLRCT